MALDFSGIENVEFYSGHYLSAVLEGDLKAIFQKWKKAKDEEGKRLPQEELAGLANRYFAAFSKAVEERDLSERLHLAQDFHAYFLEALGYTRNPGIEALDENEVIPVHLSLRRDGRPFLWVLEAPFPVGDEDADDPLDLPPLIDQSRKHADTAVLPKSSEGKGKRATWREILDERLFRLDRSPRWVLFLTGTQALLIERHKWPQGRYLRFDLGELFGRKQAFALRAMAGLLHRDVLAPESGLCLHDTLDENSHKHAYAVSGDLKHGVRRAVELLANEAVYYRREVQKQGVFSDEAFAGKLTTEILTWLYRLLFLFYVEARGKDLDAVPMDSDAYRKGYSLESLRDLELVPLTSEHARNGFFIHESLQKLFRILNMGFPRLDSADLQSAMRLTKAGEMQVDALNSPLFDDDRLELLKGVRFRNLILQEVLQLLSLSAEKKRKTRGRISYAQLGINQLGAVYEGLLSYTGFFATEDLYEVAAEKDCKQLSGKPAADREALKTYFVPASRIGDYKEGEIVKDEHDKKVVHKKGTFIFRLAGRNREKSASYYTPEVLTRCLVKYALKELLWEEGEEGEKPKRKKTADEILALTICEPAMGSSAFLIETVDQLADAYLEARQEEKGDTIPPEEYQREKRRVKARLATNNCYGVDLNPTAVELAKVSLWLATLYEEGKCPWFGLRLATGNSLVGARREVFKTADVTRRGHKDNPNWLGLVPEPVSLCYGKDGPPLDKHWTPPLRPKGTIYHFLLPAEGMAAFDKDKVIKGLVPESVKRIKEWRKEFCKPFNRKDGERLEQISDAVDRLLAQVVRERALATQETSDRIPVWGEPPRAIQADLLVRDQEEVAAALEDGSSAYRRLKLAMDAWCALWFWPIEQANMLPDRATWLAQLELILKGQVTHEQLWAQENLFAALSLGRQEEGAIREDQSGDVASQYEISAERLKRLQGFSHAFRERRAYYFETCGLADIESVLEEDGGLRTAQVITNRLKFHHWPLRFAEVFAGRGGFDLILGNPPWVKLQWQESGVLSDYDPTIETKKISAPATAKLRAAVLEDSVARRAYLEEYTALDGTQEFLGAAQNYPMLRKVQTNLYKCFITRAWGNGSPEGVASFLHPEGVYDDPKGGKLRAAIYPRLAHHYQFINEGHLFPDVHNLTKYSINVYGAVRVEAAFHHMSNLFHPRTVDSTWNHDGFGAVPGIKDADDQFDTSGHWNRLVHIDMGDMTIFASLYDEPGTRALEARLPVIHSEEIVHVLWRFAAQPQKLADLLKDWHAIPEHFHESRQQTDGTIRRDTQSVSEVYRLILQGPHFYVGTPLNKTPNEGCSTNRDYTAIDLTGIPAGYLPRTNYVPACEPSEYNRRTPKWKGKPVTTYFRTLARKMISPTGERTLVPAIIPPEVAHTDGGISVAAESDMLLQLTSGFQSLPFDFFLKSTGRTNLYPSTIAQFPVVSGGELDSEMHLRILLLNSFNDTYRELWSKRFGQDIPPLSFARHDRRFRRCFRIRDVDMFRTDLERRQALVEVDVLASIALDLTIEELLTIYRVQFPILQQYERERLYDQNCRIVPTSKTALGNPAVSLVELAATLKEQAGFDIHTEYHPDGSNTQELREQKIRLGKKEVDVLGASERCTMADLLAETEVRWSDEDHPEGRPARLVGLRYTDPGLEPRMERVYPTPWTRCDREADYRQAWAEFERRLGKKMPEGTPL